MNTNVKKTTEYLKKAFDLEMKIYNDDNLLKYYQKCLDYTPRKENNNVQLIHTKDEYVNDNLSHYCDEYGQNYIGKNLPLYFIRNLFLGSACVLISLCGAIKLVLDKGNVFAFGPLPFFVGYLGLIFFVKIFNGLRGQKSIKIATAEMEQHLKNANEVANANKKAFEENKKIVQQKIDDEYQIECELVDKMSVQLQKNHDLTTKDKEKAENELKELYSQDVIYKKYRSLVPISSIYEYFASGRCFELDGPNGAYNLFEKEIRTDIIIAELGSIVNSLEQIKKNQYSLYCAINESNESIKAQTIEVRESAEKIINSISRNTAAVGSVRSRLDDIYNRRFY